MLTTLYQACQRGQSPQPLEVYISHLILHTPLPPTGLALSLPVCGERIPMTSSPLPRFNLYDVRTQTRTTHDTISPLALISTQRTLCVDMD